jgi:hypothetical protein
MRAISVAAITKGSSLLPRICPPELRMAWAIEARGGEALERNKNVV